MRATANLPPRSPSPIHVLVFSLILILGCSSLQAQPIYKTVDQYGNVVYTDQKPSDDAEPMELPGLNVLDGDEPELPLEPEITADENIEPLQLEIVSPAHEEHIWTDGDSVTVQLSSNLDLPPGALVVVHVNDQPRQPVNSLNVRVDQLQSGEYQVFAELQTTSGRRLARTDAQTFFVHQIGQDQPEGP